MSREPRGTSEEAQEGAPRTYEAPRIEIVVTPENLEREVRYAGPAGSTFG